ncbi:MAG: hypothetical protein N0C84_17130 [Candidatus Thiodiazotropha taylori]|uniref:Uncharacterized protein n=1 Tax=Candidatus Thiodiazotropha taylori TaxID=2792791 RepID=A0A9E4N5Y5_9GAMM|nr:hypothetical protein [Candidatus Thiodiazotropha taylori]MCW4258191.1 hypothetical protein [Candidatus Thiodiazotropha taylori]
MDRVYWESDEFETAVEAGLVSFHEKLKRNKKLAKPKRVSYEDLSFARRIGPYFAPHDREFYLNMVDINPYILPSCFSGASYVTDADYYLLWVFVNNLTKLPKDIERTGGGISYSVSVLKCRQSGYIEGEKHYVSVSKDGKIHPTIVNNVREMGRIGRLVPTTDLSDTLINDGDDLYIGNPDDESLIASMCINRYLDRDNLWNVEATDDGAKATFGVYEEQIQSLLYARSIPLSVTGRKRPILHWVCAHKRRVKSGVSVDIRKHLRGISDFEMHGTEFKITRPTKENNRQTRIYET